MCSGEAGWVKVGLGVYVWWLEIENRIEHA